MIASIEEGTLGGETYVLTLENGGLEIEISPFNTVLSDEGKASMQEEIDRTDVLKEARRLWDERELTFPAFHADDVGGRDQNCPLADATPRTRNPARAA